MNSEEFKKVFAQGLVSHGYKRKKDNWYVESNDAIALVNLQPSNFSSKYYLNMASWIKLLGDENNPKENKCHVSIRLESAFPADRERIEHALDLDCKLLEDSMRKLEILDIVGKLVAPFVKEKLLTLAGLKIAYESEALRFGAVTLKAQKLFDTLP